MDENLNLGQNTEIQKALERFDTENKDQAPASAPAKTEAQSSKMVAWVIKHSGGMIREEKHAEYALLVFVIAAIALSLFIFLSSSRQSTEIKVPSGKKIVYPNGEPPRLLDI